MSRQVEDRPCPSSQGTFMITEQRPVQSPISTRVLEGLLLLMWICAITTMLLVRTRRILHRNPCTIAGMASLLAGSELLSVIPPGSEWCDNAELRKRGVFDSHLFSLGWWGTKGGDRGHVGPRWGIDVGRADKSVYA